MAIGCEGLVVTLGGLHMRAKSLVGIVLVLSALIIAGYQITKGTGPLPLARAEHLLKILLLSETTRVEVILPDGEVGRAKPDTILNSVALDCLKISSTLGSVPGRFGAGERIYGGATFECLFLGKSPSGTSLYFSSYVARSGDSSRSGTIGGDIMVLLKSGPTESLMRKNGLHSKVYSPQEQAELWAGLARDGIYVPADKNQTSPLQKAMQGHIERLLSK